MTVMAHPTKANVQRFRVQDKVLGVQEYYSVKTYGSVEAAKAAAEARQHDIDNIRSYTSQKDSLAINQLFDFEEQISVKDGKLRKRSGKAIRVKGVRRTVGMRDILAEKYHDSLRAQITVGYKDNRRKHISVLERGFDTAWQEMIDWLLETRGIESTQEIRQEFRRLKRIYAKRPTDAELAGITSYTLPK